jgi:hypothetical protein
MDREQAAEIKRHLLEAADAIDRAGQIIFGLDLQDRKSLTAPLGAIGCALHFELLQEVYDKHPELRPLPKEPARISSYLRWDEVSLPQSVSADDIDQAIFSAVTSRWRKTAMVIGNALTTCKQLDLAIDAETIGARVQALVESGRLEGQGDLRKWRHSEVRTKG